MDELPLSGPERVSPGQLFLRRFVRFAGAHFCYTVSCFFVCCFLVYLMGLALLAIEPRGVPKWLLEALCFWLLPMALMLGYLPLGYWFGGKDVWPLPLQGGDLAASVLAEAAVAWGWAAGVIAVFAMESDLVIVLFYLSVFLALPSSVFVWIGAGVLGLAGSEDPVWGLACAGFWAGLLPPLLFNLGSYWRAWQSEK